MEVLITDPFVTSDSALLPIEEVDARSDLLTFARLNSGFGRGSRAKAEGKQLGCPKIAEKTERAVQSALKRKNRPGWALFRPLWASA